MRTATPTATFGGGGGASVVTERWGANTSAVHRGPVVDTSVDAANPTWLGNGEGAYVLFGEPFGARTWALLRFELTDLAPSTRVRQARLRLMAFAHSEPLDAWQPVYPIEDPDAEGLWSETGASFNERRPGVPWSATGGLDTAIGAEAGRAYVGNLAQWSSNWVEWDVTTAVQQWVADPESNHGLALPPPDGALYEAPSRESSEGESRPYLEITYEGPNPNRPVQVGSASALHRSGQTFITWNEITAGGSEIGYRIYRHDEPITAANLDAATLIAEVGQDSGAYTHETSGCSSGSDCSPIGQSRFVIHDDGTPLATGVGLFVFTTHEAALVARYYAVTSVVEGNENRSDFGANRTGAVFEVAATPRPVRVWTNGTGTGWVYTQFMDYAVWNSHVEGYAYNFYVGVPEGYDAGSATLPLLVQLHAYTGTYRLPAAPGAGGTDYGWPVVQVFPDDRTNTWWFGFGANSGHLDQPLAGAPIVDYTHQRLDAILSFVQRGFRVDQERQYLFGGSMGGSGTLNYGLRRGNVFAAIYAESGMTDYARAGDAGGTAWETGAITSLWGTVAQDLPTNLGMGVWDWYDLQDWARSNPATELPFVADHHGRNDDIIDWETQGAPWYPAVEAGRHALVGVFDDSGHSWPGFVADSNVFRFTDFNFRRDESIPALSDASNSDDPSVSSGCRNCRVEWSSSWFDFAGAPVDAPGRYELVLRTNNGASATVDVTPRRLQAFVVTPGSTYSWENRRVSDGGLVAGGSAVADPYGLVTVRGVLVSPSGNRLILRPLGG